MRPSKAYVRLVSHLFFQGRFLTTNHRWLNHLILAQLRILKHLPISKPIIKPIFIVGIGRSGSTILGKVLSMHKDIGFLNEPKAIWYSLIPEDDVNGHFTSQYAQYRFDATNATENVINEAHHIFSFYLTVTGTQRLLDKNPEIIFRIPFVQKIFPDAKFIFLARNGWDTVRSITEWSKKFGKEVNGQVEDWWGVNQRKWEFLKQQLVPLEPMLSEIATTIQNTKRHEDMAAIEWILTMQTGIRHMQTMPEWFFYVRYEDLTKKPREVLTELSDFCGLQEDKTFLRYAEKVLIHSKSKRALKLSLPLEEPFSKTMAILNYL